MIQPHSRGVKSGDRYRQPPGKTREFCIKMTG